MSPVAPPGQKPSQKLLIFAPFGSGLGCLFSEYSHCILRYLMVKFMMIKEWDLSTGTWLGVTSYSDPVGRTGRRQAGEGIRELPVENSTRW